MPEYKIIESFRWVRVGDSYYKHPQDKAVSLQKCPICGKLLINRKKSLALHLSHKHPIVRFCYRCGVRLNTDNSHLSGKQQRNLCKSCHNKLNRIWYKQSVHARESATKRAKLTREKLRDEIFTLLGNKCGYCGFTDARALQIDHVNNNGHEEKKKFGGGYGTAYLNHVLKKVRLGSSDYQILCANCNQIKVHE